MSTTFGHPSQFMCPITYSLMMDPVIGSDGQTYERSAITNWLSANHTSPMTRQHMDVRALVPNIALRESIEQYRASRIISSDASASASTTDYKFKQVDIDMAVKKHNDLMHIHIEPPASGERQPIVFIAIVDNSGSMGEPASMGAGTESHGFTRLDLVKHAIRTTGSLLNEKDAMAILTFSTAARVVVPVIQMHEEGKNTIFASVDKIMPDAQTNIWDGIRLASTIANIDDLSGRNIVAVLLTDGFPNVNPPRGIVKTLETLRMKNPWSLHTFGFGYNLDSQLLKEISEWGNGLFGFIPDCSMVGTIFINFLANMLTTCNTNITIRYKQNGEIKTIQSGSIHLGQSRDIVVPVSSEHSIQYSTNGTDWMDVSISEEPLNQYALAHFKYRQAITDAIMSCAYGNVANASDILRLFHDEFKDKGDERIKAMLLDVKSAKESEGQIGMSPVHFEKWGGHYMRSYVMAQKLQQCMNFKDPGLQIYGGDMFKTIQDEGDKLFVELPPPKPSAPVQTTLYGYGGGAALVPASISSMAVFHNSTGACFDGNSRIKMHDGELVPISAVRPGNKVWTPNGTTEILYVVKSGSYNRYQPMTQMDKLCITPWHPIRLNNEWVFPANMGGYQSRAIQVVYNLVLSEHHIVDVEGFECITLAHEMTGPVLSHPYFGTKAILRDLAKQPGWEIGMPEYKNVAAKRDPATGLIHEWFDDI